MEVIENDFCKMWLEDGIIYGIFVSETIDEKMVDYMVKTKFKLANGIWYPTLSDITRVKNFTRAARERFSKKDSGMYTSASAIIVKSKMQVVVYNFFNSIYKAPSPAKLFNNKEDALSWLEQYKTK